MGYRDGTSQVSIVIAFNFHIGCRGDKIVGINSTCHAISSTRKTRFYDPHGRPLDGLLLLGWLLGLSVWVETRSQGHTDLEMRSIPAGTTE